MSPDFILGLANGLMLVMVGWVFLRLRKNYRLTIQRVVREEVK